MKSSEFRQITDELLSAYLDNAVTDQERALIEAAVAVEPDIAWRLDSLRQTVMLLHELPELPLPRSFTLQEAQVSDVLVARTAVSRRATGRTDVHPGFWNNFVEGWRNFWQAGNPVLRNAMATSLVLLLLLTGGSQLLSSQFETVGAPLVTAPPAPASMSSASRESAQEAAAPASEPAAGEAAPMMAAEAPAEEAAEPEAAVAMAEPTFEPAPVPEAEESGEAQEGAAPVIAAASIPTESPAPEGDETTLAAEQPAGEPSTAEQPSQDAGTEIEEAEAGEAASGEDAMAQAAAVPPVAEDQPNAEPIPGGGGPPPGGPGIAAFPFDPAARGGGGGPGMGGAGGGPEMPYQGGLLPPEAYSTDPALVPAEPMTVEPSVDEGTAAATEDAEEEAPAPAESATAESAIEELTPEAATAVAMIPPAATETPSAKSAGSAEGTEAPATGPAITETGAVTETVPVTETGILTETPPEPAVEPMDEPVAEPVAEPEGGTATVSPDAEQLVEIAQLSLGLLTVMLASLWWRSRRSRS